jgi:hypothetical protein
MGLLYLLLREVGRGSSVGIRAGRYGYRIPVGPLFSASVQTGPGAQPASYTMGIESVHGGNVVGV